jgi:hypothetical protein
MASRSPSVFGPRDAAQQVGQDFRDSWLSRRSFVRGVLRPDRPKSVLSMNSCTIEITERSVNDLRPPERSVRTHNRAQERKLTRIIRKLSIRRSRSLPGRLRRHRLHPVRYGTPK